MDKLGLDWDCEPTNNQVQSKLDDLVSLVVLHPRPVGLLPSFKNTTMRSWKQPFSVRITNAAIKETLAIHLTPNSAPSWKVSHMFPSKPCRITSALVCKFYMAAGQAAAILQSMGVLQAYQAELLKELDEGEGLTPEAVKELRRATDLALRATKNTARAVGRSMAGLVSVERHLWLTLTDIKEMDKTILLDAPISKDGLFGDSVTAVVEKFRAAKQQSAAFRQLIPRRPWEAEHQPPMVRLCSSSLHRHQESPHSEPSPMAPPRNDLGPRYRPPIRSRQHRLIDLSLMGPRPQAPSSSS